MAADLHRQGPVPASSAPLAPSSRSDRQVPRYDAHCAFVRVEGGESVPSPPEDWGGGVGEGVGGSRGGATYGELVLFENAAALPRFIITFRA